MAVISITHYRKPWPMKQMGIACAEVVTLPSCLSIWTHIVSTAVDTPKAVMDVKVSGSTEEFVAMPIT